MQPKKLIAHRLACKKEDESRCCRMDKIERQTREQNGKNVFCRKVGNRHEYRAGVNNKSVNAERYGKAGRADGKAVFCKLFFVKQQAAAKAAKSHSEHLERGKHSLTESKV